MEVDCIGFLKRMLLKIYGRNLFIRVVNIWLILDILYWFLNVFMIRKINIKKIMIIRSWWSVFIMLGNNFFG